MADPRSSDSDEENEKVGLLSLSTEPINWINQSHFPSTIDDDVIKV